MKKTTYFFALLLAGLSFFSSCENEPLEGEFFSTPDGSDPQEFCDDAPLAISNAQIALANATPEQQAELCNALIETINSTIEVCGDETGLFQALLDELGTDCMIDSGGGDNGDDDNDNDNDNAAGSITAIVDGSPFSASGNFAGANFVSDVFNITGLQADGESIVITIDEFDGVGTYDLEFSMSTIAGAAYVPETGANAFLSVADGGSGTLVVTEFDLVNNTTSGTFNFVGVESVTGDTVNVSEGVFTTLSIATEVPPGDPDNFFNAEIDGVAYDPDSIIGILTNVGGNDVININTNDNAAGSSLGITVPLDITTGVFNFSPVPNFMEPNVQYIPDINDGTVVFVSDDDGIIEITLHDIANNRIEGTFNFLGDIFPVPSGNSMEFTGAFGVNY